MKQDINKGEKIVYKIKANMMALTKTSQHLNILDKAKMQLESNNNISSVLSLVNPLTSVSYFLLNFTCSWELRFFV